MILSIIFGDFAAFEQGSGEMKAHEGKEEQANKRERRRMGLKSKRKRKARKRKRKKRRKTWAGESQGLGHVGTLPKEAMDCLLAMHIPERQLPNL